MTFKKLQENSFENNWRFKIIAKETMNDTAKEIHETHYLQILLISLFCGMVRGNAYDFLVTMGFLPLFQLKMGKFQI